MWSIFRRAALGLELDPAFHRGDPEAEPYPLWIEPERKLTVADVMALMRDHYEGTDYDMTRGLDAGPFGTPNRWRPMTWTVDGVEYSWERPISTQQTGFSFVSQSRSWLPDAVGGVFWYGLDDTFTSVYVPLYAGITRVPPSFAVGRLDGFAWDSAWWVFNFVANYANLKYSYMIEDIRAAADVLRPVWDSSDGGDGFVSLEVSPALAHDTEGTIADAISGTLDAEMQRDERVVLIGNDLGTLGGAHGITAGLLDRFGPNRVIDLPLGTGALVGAAMGAAVAGLRPIAEIQQSDLVSAGMDQLVHQVSKHYWLTGVPVPLVIRTAAGAGVPSNHVLFERSRAAIPGGVNSSMLADGNVTKSKLSAGGDSNGDGASEGGN